MLVRVVERIRSATTIPAIAHGVIAELAGVEGVRGCALVMYDAAGEPTLWIGDAATDRREVRAYLDGGFRDDTAFARVHADHVAICCDGVWVAPLLGDDGVIGMLRVVTAGDARWIGTLAAYISIRIALLGTDRARSLHALTPRQREVAELVAHGCTNAEIARMLAISANAVKKHVSRVLVVLDVTNRTELAALTGRWRAPPGTDHDLPPSLLVVYGAGGVTQASSPGTVAAATKH